MTHPTELIIKPPVGAVVLEGVAFTENAPADPDPTHARLSALVLLGSLIAACAGVHRHPDGVEVAAGAVFAAVVLFLTCLARFDAAARSAEARRSTRKDHRP